MSYRGNPVIAAQPSDTGTAAATRSDQTGELRRDGDGARSSEAGDRRRPRSPGRARRLRRDLVLLLMGAPALLVLFVFHYLPLAGLAIAFEDFRPSTGILGSHWVGLANFRYLLVGGDAWRITRNTVGMNGLFIAANLLVSLGLALLLNEIRDRSRWLSRVYQSTMFLPYVLSYVVITNFVLTFLESNTGIVNHVVRGLGGSGIDFYNSPGWWPLVLTVVEVWKGAGFWVVVYLAGIMAMNPQLFEAAALDGAGRWAQIRRITLPLLTPLIIMNVLLSVSHIFNADFGLFFQVTLNSPTLYPTTDVIDTYVYRSLTSTGDIGMAAAAGFYQAVVGFVLVVGANWWVRRRSGENALF
ncbi:sugar ABC transporter permease [Kribbella hippodromi]|uniref:Sugar ABC transporter permease n=1 Tax=Kribbella hippodromi TaxID=434347 RepID=A0ABP4PXZ4_9ACTN